MDKEIENAEEQFESKYAPINFIIEEIINGQRLCTAEELSIKIFFTNDELKDH